MDFNTLKPGIDRPPSAVERARFYSMMNIIYNFNCPYKMRLGATRWRHRAADKWAELRAAGRSGEVPDCPAARGGRAEFNAETVAAADAAIESLRRAADATNETADYLRERDLYIDELKAKCHELFPPMQEAAAASPPPSDSQESAASQPGAPPEALVAAIADWSDFGEDWAGEMVTQLQGAREGWEENADEERMDDGDGAAAAAAAAGDAMEVGAAEDDDGLSTLRSGSGSY